MKIKDISLKIAVVILAFCLWPAERLGAQTTYSATVNDENGQPLEFVTVSLRNLPDSSVVSGTVTDAAGQFSIERSSAGDYIQLSLIGYLPTELPLSFFTSHRTIALQPDRKMLEGALVTAILPKTEIKGDAVVTNIAGSVLEHTGNALDVLAKVPGMISRNGNLEVIGRGSPLFFINGRMVNDASDLRNLMSEDIKSVDVVSNPGAAYGGEVRAVVRIRTVRHQGDGFSFALTSQAKQHIYDNHDIEPSWSVLDLNYRRKGFDFIGKIVYWNQRGYQISDIYGGTYVKSDDKVKECLQEGTIDYRGHNGGFQYQGGFNWQINDNHSLGLKLEYSHNHIGESKMVFDTDVLVDGKTIDHLLSVNDARKPISNSWNGNLYYDGNIGKLNINFNADFVTSYAAGYSDVSEDSWETPVKIKTESEASTSMGAGKLVLTYPVWKGSLQLGTEETYVGAREVYSITKMEIPSSRGYITENNLAGFAQYSIQLPFGQIAAGVRYEHVNFNYINESDPSKSLGKIHNNWFPSVSFSTMAGPVGLALSYSGKTLRPRYNELSSEITYDNRFTYQTGDPTLENEIQRTLSLNANWTWLTLSASYERVDNAIYQRAFPYDDKGVAMIQFSNFKEPLRKLNFYINASPTIGVWSPRYTVGMEKQLFTTTVIDPRVESGKRTLELNRPMFLAQANNSFNFKHNWIIEFNYQYVSPFDQLIMRITKPIQNLDLAVSKSFLKNNSLNLRLSWNDILNSSVTYINTDYGNFIDIQSNNNYNPCILLRISYRFNTASSKYKGTGAGQDAKDRLAK